MKYNFQRGKGSPWWAWWKSDESFTQGFCFSIRLWETFIEKIQLSPLAIHRQALHKPLTPQLGEGPPVTLLSCREEKGGKAAEGEAAWSYPKTPFFFDGYRTGGGEYPKEGRDSQFLLFISISTINVLTLGPVRNHPLWKRRMEMVLDQE